MSDHLEKFTAVRVIIEEGGFDKPATYVTVVPIRDANVQEVVSAIAEAAALTIKNVERELG